MDAKNRRIKILEHLSSSSSALTASFLAGELKVSRQIIVGDIALLRASGKEIIATPRGYLLKTSLMPLSNDFLGVIACKHGLEDMEKELHTIVSHGGIIIDVTVEHPLYGQLTGPLNITSLSDVTEFMEKINSIGFHPLSTLTDGIHLHQIKCSDLNTFNDIKRALTKKEILYV